MTYREALAAGASDPPGQHVRCRHGPSRGRKAARRASGGLRRHDAGAVAGRRRPGAWTTISVGALTHSTLAADISMELVPVRWRAAAPMVLTLRLLPPPSTSHPQHPMNRDLLLGHFKPTWLGRILECHDVLASTNDRARRLSGRARPVGPRSGRVRRRTDRRPRTLEPELAFAAGIGPGVRVALWASDRPGGLQPLQLAAAWRPYRRFRRRRDSKAA